MLIALSIVLMAASSATAEVIVTSPEEVGATQKVEAGAFEHDGFFMRFAWGLGAMTRQDDDDNADLMATSEFSIGVAVAQNLILHLVISDLQLADSHHLDDGNVNLDGVGLGVTYYWMPYNVFVTGAASLFTGWDHKGLGSDEDLAFAGTGLQLAVGKEWWVSENWALGVRAQTGWNHLNTGLGDDDDVETFSGGLSMSITYN